MDQQIQKNKRIEWIDAAKFIAILAVMTDHTTNILYTDRRIAFLSYFSVSLFILLMGISCYFSFRKAPEAISRKVFNQSKNILIPYSAATFIYVAVDDHIFDFDTFIDHLIHFNASGPLYYVMLYLQLLLISPLIFQFFSFTKKKRFGPLIEAAGMVVVIFLCFLTTNYTNILDIYGGGGKLFGGTYLLLIYIGMWFGKYYPKIHLKPAVKWILFTVSLAAAAGWWLFLCKDQFNIDSRLPFGKGFNPPSISLFVQAIIVGTMFFSLGEILNDHNNSLPAKLFHAFSLLGRHTLYIFLYHKLILERIINISKITGIRVRNLGIRAFIYFSLMIGFSLLLELIMTKLFSYISRSYHRNET